MDINFFINNKYDSEIINMMIKNDFGAAIKISRNKYCNKKSIFKKHYYLLGEIYQELEYTEVNQIKGLNELFEDALNEFCFGNFLYTIVQFEFFNDMFDSILEIKNNLHPDVIEELKKKQIISYGLLSYMYEEIELTYKAKGYLEKLKLKKTMLIKLAKDIKDKHIEINENRDIEIRTNNYHNSEGYLIKASEYLYQELLKNDPLNVMILTGLIAVKKERGKYQEGRVLYNRIEKYNLKNTAALVAYSSLLRNEYISDNNNISLENELYGIGAELISLFRNYDFEKDTKFYALHSLGAVYSNLGHRKIGKDFKYFYKQFKKDDLKEEEIIDLENRFNYFLDSINKKIDEGRDYNNPFSDYDPDDVPF